MKFFELKKESERLLKMGQDLEPEGKSDFLDLDEKLHSELKKADLTDKEHDAIMKNIYNAHEWANQSLS